MAKRRRLFFKLNTARTLIMRRADQELSAALGLTSTQLGALFVIAASEGCLQKDIAEALYLAPSAVTGLIGRMEKANLVERRRCSEDGRAMRVYTTPEGRAAKTAALPILITLNGALEDAFTDEELDVVERFLSHAIDTLSDSHDEPEEI